VRYKTTTVAPEWNDAYRLGYIGFEFTDDSFISNGVVYFERYETVPGASVPDLPISHTFVVTGPDECVEALAHGVTISNLHERFTSPHTHVCFRKPRFYTDVEAHGIAAAAYGEVGKGYGYGLIFADLLANTVVGHWLNIHTGNVPNRIVTALCDRKLSDICSEAAAISLQSQAVLRVGILKGPARMVTPKALFEDDFVFECWRNGAKLRSQVFD